MRSEPVSFQSPGVNHEEPMAAPTPVAHPAHTVVVNPLWSTALLGIKAIPAHRELKGHQATLAKTDPQVIEVMPVIGVRQEIQAHKDRQVNVDLKASKVSKEQPASPVLRAFQDLQVLPALQVLQANKDRKDRKVNQAGTPIKIEWMWIYRPLKKSIWHYREHN